MVLKAKGMSENSEPVSAYFTLETETEAKENARKKSFDPEVKFAKLKHGVQTTMKNARREYDR